MTTIHQKNSLTEWPENLKHIIDWFLRVGGKDKGSMGYGKGKELQKAVEALGGFSKEASGLGDFHLEGLFGYVTNGLMEFIGYDGAWTVTGKGIGRNGNSPYTSSWDHRFQ